MLMQYYEDITATWQFMKEFLTRIDEARTNPDQFWKDAVDRYYQLARGQSEFRCKLLVECLKELERITEPIRKAQAMQA